LQRTVCIISICLCAIQLQAQELLVPLWGGQRPILSASGIKQSDVLTIPFFDDFPHETLDCHRWTNNQAIIANGWGLYPPTVGVATLDAVDENGELYQHISSTFPADTLLSATIRLDSVFYPFPESLLPADSLYFSFYYTPGGRQGENGGRIGDIPESQDSLSLEFYAKSTDRWVTVWSTPGKSPEDLNRETGSYWQHVMIPIIDTAYFTDAFRFRFRNLCSLDPVTTPGIVANSDQWYLDCISLDRFRTYDDIAERDVAFVHPARSLLKNYCAMPARHYRSSEMASTTATLITNRYTQPVASHYEYRIISEAGDTLHYYDGGFENVPSYPVTNNYQGNDFHANPAVDYTFPADGATTTYRIEHIVKEGVLGDSYPANDTTVFFQVFDDYFAYDDGTAENGYGLTSTSSNVYLALAFQLNEPDTLLKIRMYFNRVRNDENQNMAFRIAVWKAGANGPGERIYRDATLRHPAFAGLNTFVEYQLDQPLPLNGVVYIGLEQESGDYINIGFDRNYNHSNRLYYRIGSEWQRASISGSIMLRPCFTPFNGSLGINNTLTQSNTILKVFPNPATDRINVHNLPIGATVTLYDACGRRLLHSIASAGDLVFPCKSLPSGIYYISVTTADNTNTVHKVVVMSNR